MRDHFELKGIEFDLELKFLIDNPDGDESKMRLIDLRKALMSKTVFMLGEDDVERICDIAS